MALKRPDRVRGPLHDDFWAYCEKGELRLQQCDNCDKLLWPVMAECERCGSRSFRWSAMSGRGKLISHCSFHHDYYRGAFPIPHDIILVELEEGPLFISCPANFTDETSFSGMAIQCTFLECEDSTGHFRLPVFSQG